MRIGLLATLRDESQALPRFFGLLEALEADPRVERLFCSFYENDSSDDTPACLAAWLRDRPGVLQSERLGAPRLRGREISRTMRMAEARNKALAGFADEQLDWLVVIDADLHAKPSHIWQLIEVLQRDRGVAMACASALQNMPDIFGHSPWSYYDSYALLDRYNWLGITGALVPLRDLQDRVSGWRAALFRCRLRSVGLRCCRWQQSVPSACAGMVRKAVSTGRFVLEPLRPARCWLAPRSRRWCCMNNHPVGVRDIRSAAGVN